MDNVCKFGNDKLRAAANLSNGQLISLRYKDREYFHNGGEDGFNGEGWNNSEIIPFPIFGPPVYGKVEFDGKEYFLEQHGISRHTKDNPFILDKQDEANKVVLVQKYDGREIPNQKYKEGLDKSKYINWVPYAIVKTFEIVDNSLVCNIKVTNESDSNMPYMLGWHPAFKILGNIGDCFFVDDSDHEIVSLKKVIEHSILPAGVALIKKGISSIKFVNKELGIGLKVSSSDFSNNIMLWSPGFKSGMFCIEHTTKLPLDQGEKHFEESSSYEVLEAGKSKEHFVKIEVF